MAQVLTPDACEITHYHLKSHHFPLKLDIQKAASIDCLFFNAYEPKVLLTF